MKTKIISTIGPASEPVLSDIIEAGTGIIRINFSHIKPEQYSATKALIDKIRQVSNGKCEILCDLQGPKIRVGELENPLVINDNDKVFIVSGNQNIKEKHLFVDLVDLPDYVQEGHEIFIDDGKIKLVVEEIDSKGIIHARTVSGGKISSKRGVNFPMTKLSIPWPTEKDLRDLEFIKSVKAEYLAISFVQCADDIINIMNLAKDSNFKVISKIETKQAMENLDGIVDVSDGVMVARGDLGIEISLENLPKAQRRIISTCNKRGKFSIVATQMLGSMVNASTPTRAEVLDVAYAVSEGADAVMLSNETAVGKYPVQSVQVMKKIVVKAEE